MPGSASSAALYSHIDRAYRDFVDVAALVARQSAAEDATAATTIPVLQQMIEQKQKERERLKREAQRIQNEQVNSLTGDNRWELSPDCSLFPLPTSSNDGVSAPDTVDGECVPTRSLLGWTLFVKLS
ncbi:hypothetical protein VDGL01_12155 [Verticillium dahliae]